MPVPPDLWLFLKEHTFKSGSFDKEQRYDVRIKVYKLIPLGPWDLGVDYLAASPCNVL